MAQLVIIVAIFIIFYFLLIRPQQQRVKEHQKLVAELKVGDEVVTIGGIHGKILNLSDETVSLEIADKLVIIISRGAVARKKGKTESE